MEHGHALLLNKHWFKIVHFLGKFRSGLSGDERRRILIQLLSSLEVVRWLNVFIECVQEIVAEHVSSIELWESFLTIGLQ